MEFLFENEVIFSPTCDNLSAKDSAFTNQTLQNITVKDKSSHKQNHLLFTLNITFFIRIKNHAKISQFICTNNIKFCK